MTDNAVSNERDVLADKLFDLLHDWYENTSRPAGGPSIAKSGANSLAGGPQASPRQIATSSSINSVSFKDLAHSVYQARRLRDKIFSCTDMFGEPAWDMLLDIATAESENSRLSVTAVCIGSCAAPTTALRYVKALEKAELICREEDISDGRRQYIRLTAKGDRLLRRYFYQTFGPNSEGPLQNASEKYIENR